MTTEISATERPRYAGLMTGATFASVAVASVLIAAKFVAWLMTDSIAMLATLLDSVLDVAASLVNLYAVRHALSPADREHRFGHGKAEPLAGLAQSAFIAGSAVFLFVEAGRHIAEPQALGSEDIGLAVIALSIVMTIGLVVFQRYVIARTGSIAIKADRLHYKGDLLANASVAAAFFMSIQLGWLWADPAFGLAVAAYILWSAWGIVRQSLDQLMDRELPGSERQRIRAVVMEHPEVREMHDLRTRMSGQDVFIQLHIEMDGAMSLHRAHEVADEVEHRVRLAFPGAEVLIHQDPAGVDERRARFG